MGFRTRSAGWLAVICGAGLALTAFGIAAMPATASVRATATVTVKTAKVSGLGTVLVDAKGKTLYTHTNGSVAAGCDSTCVAAWPPLTGSSGSKVKGPKGVKGLALVAGGKQVALKGLPLYRFFGDSKTGDANGNGLNSFGGDWKAAKVSGTAAKAATTSTSGGYGY
jgi:predicted lipoprotein with Yx(FWY)xxD motif